VRASKHQAKPVEADLSYRLDKRDGTGRKRESDGESKERERAACAQLNCIGE